MTEMKPCPFCGGEAGETVYAYALFDLRKSNSKTTTFKELSAATGVPTHALAEIEKGYNFQLRGREKIREYAHRVADHYGVSVDFLREPAQGMRDFGCPRCRVWRPSPDEWNRRSNDAD